jgi:hypothetical protein
MSAPSELSGGCLCGGVRFTFKPAEPEIDACHCRMCQRWGGGPGLSIKAQGAAVITQGRELVATYKSSEWGERSFCRVCGSHLFFHAPSVGYFGVSAGTVDDLSGLTLTTEIFIDRKPAAYDFANPTHKLTEDEFVAMVSGSQNKE